MSQGQMPAYIGAKIIRAQPMGRMMFENGTIDENDEPGYMVEYPDGYRSWSPKDVFENAYRRVTDDEAKLTL